MEPEVVIIKPGELILKSKGVRKQFEKTLLFNAKECLKRNEIEFDQVIRGNGRYLIYTPETKEVLNKLKDIFGIANLCEAVQVGSEINAIKSAVFDLAEELGMDSKSTFGIRANTVNTSLPMSSREIEQEVGAFIQEKTKAKVNLTKPQFWLRIEIVENKSFIYSKIYTGLSGLPLCTGGKILALISENKTDILAAWMIMKRGCAIIPLNIRESEEKLAQFNNNCKKLERFAWGSKIKPISIKGPNKNRKEIEKVAEKLGCKAIVMGSLEPKFLDCNLPVFEPLIGLNKKELKALEKIVF